MNRLHQLSIFNCMLLLASATFGGEGHKILYNPLASEVVVVQDAPEPIYPEISRQIGESGLVYLQLKVAEDGRVVETQVLYSASRRLEKVCINSKEQMRFAPVVRNDTSYQFLVRARCRFNLLAEPEKASSAL